MKLHELKIEVQKYQYMEDTSIIDVSIASIVANRLKLGEPIWLMIIGASSGGKSQILRPLAMTDEKFIHRIDDLTENTFLSGTKAKEGEPVSLLQRIGPQGILVISDLTVLMSKSAESKATILSQFRMLYDGAMTKYSGNSSKPIRWPETGKGYLGLLAGSTPTIYTHFEDASEMGERFIYFRMKEIDPYKATHLALYRQGGNIDQTLSDIYGEYIKEVVSSLGDTKVVVPDSVNNRIIEVSAFAEKVRTVAHMDFKNEKITRIPQSAMPMRVAQQLQAIAKGLCAIKIYETGSPELGDNELSIIDWLAYSLANEEKRACLKIIASVPIDKELTTATIADSLGLDPSVVGIFLQNLMAVKVLRKVFIGGLNSNVGWVFNDHREYEIVRRIEHIQGTLDLFNRELANEEEDLTGEY